MSGHIVVVGSLNMDLVVRTTRHPQPGETLLGSDFGTSPGGKGANQAVAAARAGGKVIMIGRVGEDLFGDQLIHNLAVDGVDTTYLRRTPAAASGVALITLDENGQNTIVVAMGANGLLSPQDILDAEDAFQDAAILLLQLEIPLETVSQAVSLARKYGVRVVLNPAPARILPENLLKQVDYLIPNENELALLTGIYALNLSVDSMRDVVSGAVVATLGGKGILVVEGHERPQRLAAHEVEVVDTVAAGDAFVGCFGVALAEGKSTLDAAIFGNAAAAISVTRSGAQPSLPNRAEIDTFLGFTHDHFSAV